ncbi:MAG: lysine--tRNA ligase [Simkaniaceae bacterium]
MTTPEYHHFEEYQNRVAKLEEIRNLGINPYPPKYEPSHEAKSLLHKYEGQEVGDSEKAAEGRTDPATVAGRLVLFRAMGKNAFGHIQDSTARIQVMFNRDLTKVEGLSEEAEIKPLKFIEKKIDLGDIIGIEGHLFRTGKGELTIYAKKVTLLCKTLLPLPDKHSKITDKGVRYRKRWLDLIVHPEVREDFILRSRIISTIRKYLEDHKFIEVETPVLQNIYGGAQARPFTTHLHALHQDMFLRISLEIPLKKLIVGGMDRVFEIGKVFRNEGIDRTHNPEFTMLEAYARYWDYFDLMDFVEKLYETVALKLFGTTKIGPFDIHGKEVSIDLKSPWKRMTMKEAIKTYAKIDPDSMSEKEMIEILQKTPIDKDKLKNPTHNELVSYLFEEIVEEHLIEPHQIYDHPVETTPLCKLHRDPKIRKQGYVERFETFILGYEFCNAYTELNDPVLQRKLLEEQAAKRKAGDEEANPMDEEFVEAICQGMPPTGGFGIGLDRLVMLFTKVHSIRDVLFFPVMRPEE